MNPSSSGKIEITVGHSPDADDAFMFYPLTAGKIDTERYVFRHAMHDIETLNRKALDGELPLTAISVAAFPDVAGRYAMMRAGGSFGDGYGPVVVARTAMSIADLAGKSIAVPGLKTSAFLALNLCMSGFRHVVVPFDRIMDCVAAGDCDAGLVIHEGQLNYKDRGFHLVVDLGVWWRDRTNGLPLPLGVNAIRRDIDPAVADDLTRLFSRSIAYSLAHRDEALAYAQTFSRGMDRALTDRFVGWYVNDLTVDMGNRGEAAIRRFLSEGAAAGIVRAADVEFTSKIG